MVPRIGRDRRASRTRAAIYEYFGAVGGMQQNAVALPHVDVVNGEKVGVLAVSR
jgi:hypothetical protein